MSSNSFGEIFRVTTFGESHGPAVGAVVDGVPAGLSLDLTAVGRELERRRPGQSDISSPRREPEELEVLAGLCDGMTSGAPLCLLVRNKDARPADYDELAATFRPGHGDYTWWKKFSVRDVDGGGRLSGRETLGRVLAGSVAKQILQPLGISVVAYTLEAAGIRADRLDLEVVESNPMRAPDLEAAERMLRAVHQAQQAQDSVGGIVEIRARGVPAGLGDPVFDKLEARLGAALLSIGAVKGVEIGDGFAHARLLASATNDSLGPQGPLTNHAGGILGGISTGAEIVLRVAVKAPSSISRPQSSVTLKGEPATVRVQGRHDACICPRLVPVAEAMVAIVLVDAWLRQTALAQGSSLVRRT